MSRRSSSNERTLQEARAASATPPLFFALNAAWLATIAARDVLSEPTLTTGCWPNRSRREDGGGAPSKK